MTNRKGPDWEIQLLKYLRENGIDAERLRLTGKEDEGDLVVRDGGIVIVECKNEKNINLAAGLTQAGVEAGNYAKHRGLDLGLVTPAGAFKRRNHSPGQAYLVTTVDTFFDIGTGGTA